VITATVYSGRREAGLVMTSLLPNPVKEELPTNDQVASQFLGLSVLWRFFANNDWDHCLVDLACSTQTTKLNLLRR
jgi:hypothetical protein